MVERTPVFHVHRACTKQKEERHMNSKFAALAVLAMSPSLAFADFTGDDVTGEIVGGPGAFAIADPNAVVGPGVEFVVDFVGSPSHEVDIDGVTMELSSVFGGKISTGAGEVLVIGDLDSSVPGQVIVGITNFETNEPEYTIDDVSFTDREVRFEMSPNIWAVDGFVRWDVVLSPAAGLELDYSGGCPGAVSAAVTGATPNGDVGLLFAFGPGNFTIPSGFQCAGTQLGLSNAGLRVASQGQADANGEITFTGNAPQAACGGAIQVIDLTSCDTSNVETLN